MNSASGLPIEIDVKTVQSMQNTGEDFLLVDCREQDEHDLVRIDGAVLIPLSQMQARIGELEPHRDKHLVIHCHHGGRSLQVVGWLRQQGFSQVQNMTGGIDAWSQEVDLSLPRY